MESSSGRKNMTKQEYEALVERMLSAQLKETEDLADYDENGLETIDLSDEKPTSAAASKP